MKGQNLFLIISLALLSSHSNADTDADDVYKSLLKNSNIKESFSNGIIRNNLNKIINTVFNLSSKNKIQSRTMIINEEIQLSLADKVITHDLNSDNIDDYIFQIIFFGPSKESNISHEYESHHYLVSFLADKNGNIEYSNFFENIDKPYLSNKDYLIKTENDNLSGLVLEQEEMFHQDGDGRCCPSGVKKRYYRYIPNSGLYAANDEIAKRDSCDKNKATGMNSNQEKALKYIISKKFNKGKVCIDSISALDKIKIRGNTIIKYEAALFFPDGYDLKCLRKPKSSSLGSGSISIPSPSSFMRGIECSQIDISQGAFIVKPLKPGESLTIKEEEEI